MNGKIVTLKRIHRALGSVLACALLLTAMAPLRVLAQAPRSAGPDNPIIQKYRQLIPQLMAEQDIPGLAVAVVDDTKVLWVEGFGYTDDDHKTPITSDTIFSVQSTSKNFTAAAVLLAVQDDLLDLDTPITDGDGRYRPPLGLTYMIDQHQMQSSEQDRLRRKEYEGIYSPRGWGVLDPSRNSARVYLQGSHLYIKASDETYPLLLIEVSPGLFFATNGEALDFRGSIPTWRNIKLIRAGTGPSLWQQVILAICALVFLSGLLFFPLRGLIRRVRHTVPPARPASRWPRLTPVLVILSSIFGLLSMGMIAAFPTIIYSGFLGWLELLLWQRVIMHMPFALLVTGVGFLILNVPAWKKAWWSRGERIYFLAFCLAAVATIILLGYWHLIGLGLG